MSKIRLDIEEIANEILINNDMLKIPVSLEQIAKNNKVEVYYVELPDNIAGAIRYYKKEDLFQILISEKDSYVRQRFTLAHELGHLFLHSNVLKSNENAHIDIMYRSNDAAIDKEKEKEADYFAGALLMDKLLLEKMYNENNQITELAQIFEVSESAMTVRLITLGLI